MTKNLKKKFLDLKLKIQRHGVNSTFRKASIHLTDQSHSAMGPVTYTGNLTARCIGAVAT